MLSSFTGIGKRMRQTLKLALLATMAMAVLSIFAGTASANRGFAGGGPVRDISRAVTFTGPEGLRIICEVTMNKSFHQFINKVRGTLAGFVMNGISANCVNSLGLMPTNLIILPQWHIQYNSFAGVLPRITEILFIIPNARFLLQIERTFCLYEGLLGRRTSGVTGGGYIAQRLIFQRGMVPLFFVLESGLIPCPPAVEVAGSFNIEPPAVFNLV